MSSYCFDNLKRNIIFIIKIYKNNSKNKTNHPSNSHPSATSNIAIHCLKRGGGGGKHHKQQRYISANEPIMPH